LDSNFNTDFLSRDARENVSISPYKNIGPKVISSVATSNNGNPNLTASPSTKSVKLFNLNDIKEDKDLGETETTLEFILLSLS
jgi:hypothetical protein